MEEDSIEDGALRDYFKKGKERKERKKKRKERAARDQGKGKDEDGSGEQGDENHGSWGQARSWRPLPPHLSQPLQRGYIAKQSDWYRKTLFLGIKRRVRNR
jgi:hypothetical protein